MLVLEMGVVTPTGPPSHSRVEADPLLSSCGATISSNGGKDARNLCKNSSSVDLSQTQNNDRVLLILQKENADEGQTHGKRVSERGDEAWVTKDAGVYDTGAGDQRGRGREGRQQRGKAK